MQSRSLTYSPKNGHYEQIPRASFSYLFGHSTQTSRQTIFVDPHMFCTNRKGGR